MRFRNLLPAALLLASALVSPSALHAQIEEGRVPLRTAVTELNTFRVEFADDYNRKDAAAVTALYDADASVILADGSVLMGRAAIGKRNAVDAAKWPHLVIKYDSMRVYGNNAVDVGTSTYHPASGPTVVERYLIVMRRGMKDWKIVRLALVPMK
jgi:ketosteroid isomerase-like protein